MFKVLFVAAVIVTLMLAFSALPATQSHAGSCQGCASNREEVADAIYLDLPGRGTVPPIGRALGE